MLRYVCRGFEEQIIDALERWGAAVLLGIPGVGKTTTARYIAVKMRERGYIPVILSSIEPVDKEYIKIVTFRDEKGKEHQLFLIPVKHIGLGKDAATQLATLIADLANYVAKEVLESKDPQKALEKVLKKLKLKETFKEIVQSIVTHIAENTIEAILSAVISGILTFFTYRTTLRANPEENSERERA